MINRKIFLLSTTSTIIALLAVILIANSISAISSVDNYALIQTSAMLSAFWVNTRIDYETSHIKSDKKSLRIAKIPLSYYIFSLVGIVSILMINSFHGKLLVICLVYVTIFPLLYYQTEYYSIALISENNLSAVYYSRMLKQLLPVILAIITRSVEWIILGAIFSMIISSVYLKICLKTKVKWIYVDICTKNNEWVKIKNYQIGLVIAASMAAMWYFERLSLSLIETGLVSIAYFSLQLTNTAASLIAGTLASMQFNNSNNILKLLKKNTLRILLGNVFIMILIYIIINIIGIWFISLEINSELLKVVKNNIHFVALYLIAAVPVSTALFLGRMYVASGSFDLMIKIYMISLPIHFLLIGIGLYIENSELLAMHLIVGNLIYCMLALNNRDPNKDQS
jgi:hypothetical protein